MEIDVSALEHLDTEALFREFEIATTELNAEERRIWYSMLTPLERLLYQVWFVERAWGKFADAVQELAVKMAEALQPVMEWLYGVAVKLYGPFERAATELRRENLYWKLRYKRLPHRVAAWLSRRWPLRWLPQLQPMAP